MFAGILDAARVAWALPLLCGFNIFKVMNGTACQACRLRPAEHEILLETEKELGPYKLCQPCAHRLDKLSLRPLEWFNLAAIHGPSRYHLHDDFYDEDGIAYQPDEPMENPEKFPMPSLSEIKTDLERLVDMVMSRWFYSRFLTPDLASAVDEPDQSALLESLQRRVIECHNPCIEASAYCVAAVNLKAFAGEWIRTRETNHSPECFNAWSHACAACLPFNEGFSRVTAILALKPFKHPNQLLAPLFYFRGDPVLDWLEDNIKEPITEDWGRAAALAGISWPRISTWLAKGRPFSLVGLDALNTCWRYNSAALKEAQPKLHQPASREEMISIIKECISKDGKPRAIRVGQNAIAHIDEIVTGGTGSKFV